MGSIDRRNRSVEPVGARLAIQPKSPWLELEA
jgi:hypothetical protein